MSDKDRQKKDHKRKDKENRAMREAEGERKQVAAPRRSSKESADVPDSQPDSKRRRSQ